MEKPHHTCTFSAISRSSQPVSMQFCWKLSVSRSLIKYSTVVRKSPRMDNSFRATTMFLEKEKPSHKEMEERFYFCQNVEDFHSHSHPTQWMILYYSIMVLPRNENHETALPNHSFNHSPPPWHVCMGGGLLINQLCHRKHQHTTSKDIGMYNNCTCMLR